MREIRVSTEVFARIWSLRQEGEEDESEILDRLLSNAERRSLEPSGSTAPSVEGKRVKWREDVVAALEDLGGEADLPEIYAAVRSRRRAGGRNLPASTNSIVRRELEYNSSDSHAFTRKRDLFRSVNGIGGGRWALR